MAVAKHEAATVWYEAILRDLQFDKAWVAFDHGVWPSREVACQLVRLRAQGVPLLEEHAEVEARFLATEQCPGSWEPARILRLQEQQALCRVDGRGELMLPLDRLRAPSLEPSLNPLAFTRLALEVDPPLRPWLLLADCRGCLEQVRSKTHLHLATPGVQLPQGGNGVVVQELDAIILIGSEAATSKAAMVVRIHLQHQGEVESFHRRRNKKMEILKDLQSTRDAQLSFQVPADQVGRLCGRRGDRVQKVEAEQKVEVRICDGKDDQAPKTVLIYSDSLEAAEAARDELELRQMEYPLPEDQAEWFQKDGSLKDIAKKAGLSEAKFGPEGLLLLGSHSALEDAVLLLENHLEYFQVYK
ncbi:unnamed protein product, partial [Effrenium voratum]